MLHGFVPVSCVDFKPVDNPVNVGSFVSVVIVGNLVGIVIVGAG
jgi:hypothetical protein